MTFDEVLTQVLELLQHQGRVSYRAIKRRFDLDDEYIEDLKVEIIKARQQLRTKSMPLLCLLLSLVRSSLQFLRLRTPDPEFQILLGPKPSVAS